MSKPLKNEINLLGLINQIQAQLVALDKKVDTLINRSLPESRPSAQKPPVHNPPMNNKPNDRNKGRPMHTAICADCKKECTIPFKPSGDRPVYCQDCFSRRKVINLSGMNVINKPQELQSVQAPALKEITTPKAKTKKKTITTKKPVIKKKPAPKKK